MKSLLVLAILFTAPLVAEEQATKLTFLLPINWAATPRYSLDVSIPPEYKALQTIEQWSEKSTTLIEFVPKEQTGDDWTEIITLSKFIDQKIPAGKFVEALKERLLASVENGRVLKEEQESSPAYSQATCFIAYDLHGKHEVLGMKYFSGPYDLVGVQYTIRPTGSDAEAVEKIQQFLSNSVKVISEEKSDHQEPLKDFLK